jgi:molybdate transport repressor ModE-like protein
VFKVEIRPTWELKSQHGESVVQRLIDLLVGISEEGSLAKACARAQLSYRYAWGILRSGQKILGAPLVESTRGSGAKLTALGEKLVWANKRIAARLSPLLDTLSSEIEVEFERAVAHAESILRIHASHGFAVEMLHRFLTRSQIAADVKYRNSMEVVSALLHDSCDLAGMHVPLGDLAPKFLRRYSNVLRNPSYRLVDLVTRNQGLMVAKGNPKRITGVRDLARRGVRFVNRQSDSGTRYLFDLLLAKHKVDDRAIQGYDTSEFTHAAVAAYVASGMADVGFGVETPARKFGLDFIPLLRERYFFLFSAEKENSAVITEVLGIIRSPTFQKAVDKLPGYSAVNCGRVSFANEAFK